MAFEFALASAAVISTVVAILLLHLVKCGKKKKDDPKPRIFERNARQEAMDKGEIIAKAHDYPTMEDVKSVWNTVGDDDAKDSDAKADSKKDGGKGKSDRKGKKTDGSERKAKKADGSEKKDARKAGGGDDKKEEKTKTDKETGPKPDADKKEGQN